MASRGEGSRQAVSAGHVSMMNDVLISQLSPEQLRSSLRVLLGASHVNATTFTSYTSSYLNAHPLTPPTADVLFPGQSGLLGPDAAPSEELLRTLREARIRFSAHVMAPAFELLASVPRGMTEKGMLISNTSGRLWETLVYAGGDMVQAGQAFKEGGDRSEETRGALLRLTGALQAYHTLVVKAQREGNNAIADPLDRAIPQLVDAARLCFPDFEEVRKLEVITDDTLYSPKKSKTALSTTTLGPLKVPRLFFGMWQLSSPAWGSATADEISNAISRLVSNGFLAADMADHYGDAEILFGTFRNHLMFPTTRPAMICATKYCQFAPIPKEETIDRDWVMKRVKERSDRVQGVVDLLQIHWQRLEDKRYLEVFDHLVQISQTHPEVLRAVGLCNCDTATTTAIAEHLLSTRGEVGIVSNQVQYSLIDHRPRFAMAQACLKYGIKLVTYGTFCGGFLSDRWLDKEEPNVYAEGFNTSQRKYLDMIRAWGGWDLFQELLQTLRGIAHRHNVSVSNVAARWVLDQPETGVVIIGSRLGVTSHDESNLLIDSFKLSAEDKEAIESILKRSRGKQMFEDIGDCGAEYR